MPRIGFRMTEHHHEGDHKQPAPDKQADRVERKTEHKTSVEASGGMVEHNKTIVKEIEEKRLSRKSGATKNGFHSADSLLPHEDPNKAHGHKADKAPLNHKVTEAPGQHPKLEAPPHKPEIEQKKTEPPNIERAKEAARNVFQSVYNAGSGALNETGKFLKGMGDGEVEFVKETGQSLAVARDYYGQALTGKVNVGADVKEFGGAIGQTLGTAGDYYINQIPKGQANLGNDIGQAGKAAADHWNSLDSEQKGHFVGKEIVPLAVPGAVGIVAKEVQSANLVGKAGEAITALTSAEKIAQMEQKINQLQGHVQKFSEVLGKPMQPAYATVSDGPGRLMMPLETAKTDDGILMMKGDKGLPQGVKPSEKVSISRNGFNAQGDQTYVVDVPEKVFKAAELQGFDRKVVQEKLEKLADGVHKAHLKMGDYDPKIHGTERAYGNAFHEKLRENLNKLGDSELSTEASYLKGNTSDWGKLGTSRVDVSLGNKNEPFASVCLKTLKAIPSAQQERGWVRNLPRLKDGSIPPRLHLKLPEGDK
ncbi:MAG: hypothetical protein K2X81_25560 [Candidatus Obscuribacterales bacterium]|nr:hypothetical protein [Candidatus Obscuribacterales bacterium]